MENSPVRIVYILEGAERSTGTESVSIPSSFSGDTLELYIAFISEDGSKVSNSAYLGSGTAS